MEKITTQIPAEFAEQNLEASETEIRTLQDLEMVLVGGGSDATVTW